MNLKTYEETFSFNNLYDAYKKSRKGVQWKGTVQAYKTSAISRLYETKRKLMNGTFKTGRFHKFTIMERGKLRHIQSVNIEERVVQRCLCDQVLVETLSRKFIFDNSACIKGKGTHFAIKRLKRNLHRYWLRHKTNEGYILQWDFHHYFDTIPHDQIKKAVLPLLRDKRIGSLFAKLVDDFDGDRGMGLGSQISQISALFYPRKIDDELQYRFKTEGNGRFMDDGYAISESKEVLQNALQVLRELANSLGIEINEKKTQINKLNGTFQFLKARVTMGKDGKITVKPNRRNMTRNNRKLRKIQLMWLRGELNYQEAKEIYRTTDGNFQNFDAYNARHKYQCLFKRLFKGGIRYEIPNDERVPDWTLGKTRPTRRNRSDREWWTSLLRV